MFVVLHGAYSYSALFYYTDCLTKAQRASIQDIVEGLEAYPLYDEDAYSNLEYALTIELLEDSDFLSSVYAALPDDFYKPCDADGYTLDYDDLSQTQKQALSNLIMQAYHEQGDIYATFENPFCAYIDEDDMAKAIAAMSTSTVWFDMLKGIAYPTSKLSDNKQDTMLMFIP